MISRRRHLDRLQELLDRNPVVAILGARQVGKTTLARQFIEQREGTYHFFDLESPKDLARLQEPELALGRLDGLVVLDEVQQLPEIFRVLRVLVDRPEARSRFLLLGSAAPDLLRQSSESLAGRIAYHELNPLDVIELSCKELDRLWLRGGFPRSFLSASDEESADWRRGFVRTFLERDLPALGITIPSPTLRRFWTMLAHVHGGVWNGSRFASCFGVADTTVRRYLDLMTAALVVRQLPPWFENVSKRQVRSPKVYISDSGMLHTLLDLDTREAIESHPQLGASWKGFLLSQIQTVLGARTDQCFFWATHAGAELDLLITAGNRRLGFEIKRTATPRLTRSLRSAIDTLKIERAWVIHGGDESFSLAEDVEAVAASRILEDLSAAALRGTAVDSSPGS